jgi:hypothetical protein
MKTREEKILEIINSNVNMHLSCPDYEERAKAASEIASLPLDMPSEEEINKKYPLINFNDCTAMERVNIGFYNSKNENKRIGFNDAITEILNRNK